MKQCPFCKGQVPDEALKCQHCGEWTDGRMSGSNSELHKAAVRLMNVYVAMILVVLLFAIVLFCFFYLPGITSIRRDFHL